jgi:type IV pilus assembly protein PilN
MANINLLPWRAERRKQREREFYMMLAASAVAALAVLFLAIFWMGHRIDAQNDRNAYLQSEIKALDKQIEEINELDKTRSALLTRKEIIEQLQSNRSQMVHLFDEMVKTIPEGVRLTSMKQAGETLTLEGVAESNSRVASYMRNIDNSPWMGRTDLRKIENKSGTKDVDTKMPYEFSLDVKLRKPEDVQQAEQAALDAAAAPATDAAVTAPATNGETPATAASPAGTTPAPTATTPATTPAATPAAGPPASAAPLPGAPGATPVPAAAPATTPANPPPTAPAQPTTQATGDAQ